MKEKLQNSPIACAFFTVFCALYCYGAFIDGSMIFAVVGAIFALIWFGGLINCLHGDDREYKEIINKLLEENKRLKAENRNNDTPKKEFVEVEEKKDNLLFEVAKWAIECGNGLSTSAVQQHFNVCYSRAGKIVDQLFGMGLCARSTGKPCRAMLIDMDQLMQLERSGAFAGTMKYKL